MNKEEIKAIEKAIKNLEKIHGADGWENDTQKGWILKGKLSYVIGCLEGLIYLQK